MADNQFRHPNNYTQQIPSCKATNESLSEKRPHFLIDLLINDSTNKHVVMHIYIQVSS